MLRLGDEEIIEINSMLLLFSDNRTNKLLPWNCCSMTKDNQKNMNHETWNYKEEVPMKVKLT